MKQSNWLATLACILVPAAADAQDYVGVAGGPTRLNVDCIGADRCDRTDLGLKVYGGFGFTPAWAGEILYQRFGKARASGGAGLDLALKATALGAGIAYTHTLAPDWSLVGRAGLARVRAEESGTQGGQAVSAHQSSTQPYVGIALGWALDEHLKLSVGLDLSRLKYGGEWGSLRMLSAGVALSF